MSIFQYQAKAEPLIQFTAGNVPDLSWLPTFPDQVPHRRSVYAPSQTFYTPLLFSITPVRVSQLPVEDAFQYASVLTRVSQLPVEVATQYATAVRRTRLSQIAVEIIYPFGCHTFVPPLPSACPVVLSPGTNTQPCADDAPIFP